MKKLCARCGKPFDCLHDSDIEHCHCATVQLTPSQRQKIKATYEGCLCNSCLRLMAESLE
ncbi:MAG: hypothetical protein E7147_03765 [Rikenellaceae bacterium]|nr:hypothetical protein [Rikenellaceae bacterium]